MCSIRLVLIFSLVVTSIAGFGPGKRLGQCAVVLTDDFSSNPVGVLGVPFAGLPLLASQWRVALPRLRPFHALGALHVPLLG